MVRVMRTHPPGRSELGSSGDEQQQGRLRPAFGNPANEVDRCRISPMDIFKRQHDRLTTRTSHYPIGECCQLPTPQFLRGQSWRTFLRKRNVQQGREQRDVLSRIDLDLSQRVLEVGEPPLRR